MKGSEGPSELLRSIPRPERPLHKVLQSAKDEGIADSELALLEYGSLLHSEKLLKETEIATVRQIYRIIHDSLYASSTSFSRDWSCFLNNLVIW
jgi:hypothetical protein